MRASRYHVWGSELSPFHAQGAEPLPPRRIRRAIAAGGGWNTRRACVRSLRVTAVRRGLARPSFPVLDALDELPLVPYLLAPAGDVVFDSSAIADWIDAPGSDRCGEAGARSGRGALRGKAPRRVLRRDGPLLCASQSLGRFRGYERCGRTALRRVRCARSASVETALRCAFLREAGSSPTVSFFRRPG